jgi:hypothetical protein
MRRAALLVAALAGCQDNVSTFFPPGLEPFEDNEVPDATGEPSETIRLDSSDGDTVRVHGRGLVFTSPARLWELAHQTDAMVARCSTDERRVMVSETSDYEFQFVVHYTVYEVLTVEWDDEWRYGVITGTADAPELGMIKHKKIQGSDFIDNSEGTVQVIATDDPEVTELAFVEHLSAVSGGVSDVERGMRDNYNRLVALAHDAPPPSCP